MRSSARAVAWAEAVKAVYGEAKAASTRADRLAFNRLQRRRLRGRLEALARPVAAKPKVPPACRRSGCSS